MELKCSLPLDLLTRDHHLNLSSATVKPAYTVIHYCSSSISALPNTVNSRFPSGFPIKILYILLTSSTHALYSPPISLFLFNYSNTIANCYIMQTEILINFSPSSYFPLQSQTFLSSHFFFKSPIVLTLSVYRGQAIRPSECSFVVFE